MQTHISTPNSMLHVKPASGVVLATSAPHMLDSHLVQTNLFWLHLTKECAANIHLVSFPVLWQSVVFCKRWFSA